MRARSMAVVVVALAAALGVVRDVGAQDAGAASLAGVWQVRREVEVAQRCERTLGATPGDIVTSLWVVDAIRGGQQLRVAVLGSSYEGLTSLGGTSAGGTIQLSSGTHTFALGLQPDGRLVGSETYSGSGSCRATRSVTATRLR